MRSTPAISLPLALAVLYLNSGSIHAADAQTHSPRREAPLEDLKKVRDYFREARGKFDTNQDQKLDETEIAAYKAAAENGSFPKPPSVAGFIPERLKRFDADGDGALSDSERIEFTAQALSRDEPRLQGRRLQLPPELRKRYDADNDGQLSESEREALKGDIRKRRAELQSRGENKAQ